MRSGRSQFSLEDIDINSFQDFDGMSRKEDIKKVVNYLKKCTDKRNTSLYIFFNPDLEKYSKNIGVPVKKIFSILKLLVSSYPNYFKIKAVLDIEDMFYILQEEDMVEIEESGTLHNPYNPRIVYENARDIIRHTFVFENHA